MTRLNARRTGDGRVRRTLRAVWFVVLVSVTALTVLAFVLGAFATGERACARACHAMAPYADAAADSPHASTPCVRCHGTSGSFGMLADGWALQRRALSVALGREPVAQQVSDTACRECHAAVLADVVVSRGIAVRHSDFSQERCALCHAGTGHALPGRTYDVAQMDDCMSCHSSSGEELSGCAMCHMPDADRERLKGTSTWRITHGPRWRTTHGMGDLKTCVSCHAPAYCARCHRLALPHPPSWPKQHGKAARAVETKTCVACHESTWCADCHGVEMPHRDGFLPAHGEDAHRLGETTCYRCHPEAGCVDCHLRSAHPDVPGVEPGHTGTVGEGG